MKTDKDVVEELKVEDEALLKVNAAIKKKKRRSTRNRKISNNPSPLYTRKFVSKLSDSPSYMKLKDLKKDSIHTDSSMDDYEKNNSKNNKRKIK